MCVDPSTIQLIHEIMTGLCVLAVIGVIGWVVSR